MEQTVKVVFSITLKLILLCVSIWDISAYAVTDLFCQSSATAKAPNATPAASLWANINTHCHERGQTRDPQGWRRLQERRRDDAAVSAHTGAPPSATVTDTERARNANAMVGERHLRAARRCHESIQQFKKDCPFLCNHAGRNCKGVSDVMGNELAAAEAARVRKDEEAQRYLQNANVTDASTLPDVSDVDGRTPERKPGVERLEDQEQVPIKATSYSCEEMGRGRGCTGGAVDGYESPAAERVMRDRDAAIPEDVARGLGLRNGDAVLYRGPDGRETWVTYRDTNGSRTQQSLDMFRPVHAQPSSPMNDIGLTRRAGEIPGGRIIAINRRSAFNNNLSEFRSSIKSPKFSDTLHVKDKLLNAQNQTGGSSRDVIVVGKLAGKLLDTNNAFSFFEGQVIEQGVTLSNEDLLLQTALKGSELEVDFSGEMSEEIGLPIIVDDKALIEETSGQ